MTTLSIRFKGVQDKILNQITKAGLAETKSEAVRMALLKFAVDFNLINQKLLVDALRADLKKDRKSIGEVLKSIKSVKHAGLS